MRRIAAGVLAVLTGGLLLTAIGMRAVSDSAAGWHVDPVAVERTGAPNDYLVAPNGITRATPDRDAPVFSARPAELMTRFDAVALQAKRTRRIAGSPQQLWATYVQRSRILGFPDYVTVRAIEVPGGSALVVWSRSRFGYGDMGVNRARVEEWIAALN